MRSPKTLFLISAAMMSFLLSAGCDLTLGPKTKTVYTIVYPGKPLEILEQVKVKARVIDGAGDPITQDIGGWICLPPEHWEAVKRALEAKK